MAHRLLGLAAATLATVTLVGVLASPAWSIQPGVQPPFTEPIPWHGPDVQFGDEGPWVTELQRVLMREGFPLYDRPGQYGRSTAAAVRVFSKAHGVSEEDGFQGGYWSPLLSGTPLPGRGGEDHRIEIDLNRQILYLIEDSQVQVVLPVSTASGDSYHNFYGQLVRSRTPEGRFELYNRRNGWHESYLGMMYSPFYFLGGYAIHGSPEVPWYPASHGCVRVRMSDMQWLKHRLELGVPVYVYGNRLERMDVVPRPRLIPLGDLVNPSPAAGRAIS